MEYIIDIDIIGEILIPLENTSEKNNKTFINLGSIIDLSFNDFRSILFQGEVLRYFLVLKIDSPHNIDLIEEMYFKLEFDPSCDMEDMESTKADEIENDLGFPNENENNIRAEADLESDTDTEKPNYTDLFAIHRNTLFTSPDCITNNTKQPQIEKIDKQNFNYKNQNHDFVSRKVYFPDKKIAIFEILKHISTYNMLLSFVLFIIFLYYKSLISYSNKNKITIKNLSRSE